MRRLFISAVIALVLTVAIGSISYAGSIQNFIVNLTSQVTGTLPVANGGTGSSTNVIDKKINSFGGSQNVTQTLVSTSGVNYSNGTDTQRTYRSAFQFPQYTYDIRVCFPNYSVSSSYVQSGNGNSITVDAALEYNSAYVPLTFFGQTTVLIPSGSEACSDPAGMDIPAGATAYVRTAPLVTAGGKWPLNLQSTNSATNSNNGSDLTNGTGALANSCGGSNCYAPNRILGSTYPKTSGSFQVDGDSIACGTGDGSITTTQLQATSTWLNSSFIYRALGVFSSPITYPWQATCQGGTTLAQHLTQSNVPALTRALSQNNFIITNIGTNDLGTLTLNQFKTNYVSYWTYLASRGYKVYQTTLNPKTTSTDHWQTTANQSTQSFETVRTGVNDWLRTIPAPLSGVIDSASTVECNSANVLTVDGGYYCVFQTAQVNSIATSGSANTLNDTGQTWTTNQWDGYVVLITSGTNAGSAAYIYSNTATQLTAYGLLAPDATSHYVIQKIPTTDGTHPSPFYHQAMSVPVSTVVNTLAATTP